jgi:hypothetical protein
MPCLLTSSGPPTTSDVFDKELAPATPMPILKGISMDLPELPSSRPTALDFHWYIFSCLSRPLLLVGLQKTEPF